MDEGHVGEVGRWLRAFVDRRNMLRSLPVVLGGASLGLGTVPGQADQEQRKRKKRCRKKTNRTVCGTQCVRGICCPGKPCGDENCTCDRAIEGDAFCALNAIIACAVGTCASSGECDLGERCVQVESSPTSTCCAPEC